MGFDDGQIIAGKYRVSRKVGEGAMGSVHEAEDVASHRRVALKILHPHVAERQDALARFAREAQAAGRIGSPHIVEVLDQGELEGGGRYLVMELLEGETLAQRVQARGKLDPEDAAPLVAQLLAGLGAAHAAGIFHRDVKPANVFLAREPGAGDFVKILDFGVSKFVEGDGLTMTGTHAVLGTPYYMSPEQAKGASEIDERADLYSVGVILYECLSGHVPFDASTVNELIFRIVLEPPPPLASFVPDLDPDLAAIVEKAMAREPAERFQSARAFQDALVGWLSNHGGGHPHTPGTGRHRAVPWLAPQVDAPSSKELASGPTPRAFAAPAIRDSSRRAERPRALGDIPLAAPSEGDTLIWDRPRRPAHRRSSIAFTIGVVGAILAATAILFAFRPSSDRAPLAGAAAAPVRNAEPPATAPPAVVATPVPAATADAAPVATAPSAAPDDTSAPQRAAVKPRRPFVPKHVVKRTVSSEL